MSELCFVSPGTLEDWDLAIQKTETRLARVNEQRMKVTAGLPEGWERHCSAPVVCFGSFAWMSTPCVDSGQKRASDSGTGVSDSCELPYGCHGYKTCL